MKDVQELEEENAQLREEVKRLMWFERAWKDLQGTYPGREFRVDL